MSNSEIIEWLKKKAEAVPMPGARKMYEAAAKALEAAQPEHGTNLAEVGTDCISRQAAIDALRKLREEDIEDYGCEIPEGFNQDHLDRATFAIKQLPPIQPDIVRCKDCKHWIPYDWMFREVWQSKNIADYPEDEIGCDCSEMAMKANDFCSRAERREDARLNQQTGGD